MTDFLAYAGFAQNDMTHHEAAPPVRSRATAIPHDKFYTPHAVAARCVARVMDVIGPRPDDLYLEPSAGAGAFCAHLPADRLIALDIAPESPGIETQDFLTLEPPQHAGRLIVIGNPPFGRNGILARAFMRKAMEKADTVAFILPASYAKLSMQRGIDRSFHLVHEEMLPGQHFETHLGGRIVNTVFQIWRRQAVPRDITPETISETDFAFVKDIARADLVIRRAGARAGVILPVPDLTCDGAPPRGYAPSSNYYIRSIGCDPVILATRLEALALTALAAESGIMPSLPKPAIIAAYDEAWRAQEVMNKGGDACTDEAGMGASVQLSSARDIDQHDADELDHPDPSRGEASLEPVGDHATNEISHSGRPGDRRDQGPLTGESADRSADEDGTGEVGCPVASSGPVRPQGLSPDPLPPWMHTQTQSRCPLPVRRDLVPPIRATGRNSPRSLSPRWNDQQAAIRQAPVQHFRAEDEACAGGTARGPPVPGWCPRPVPVFDGTTEAMGSDAIRAAGRNSIVKPPGCNAMCRLKGTDAPARL